MKYSKAEKQESLEKLKSWIKKGDTLHTTVKHVSRSGMMRYITTRHLKPFHGDHGDQKIDVSISNYDYHVARVLDLPLAPNYEGVKIGGCGMDMGFHLVYSLSRELFKDEPKGEGDRDHGYWIKQEWL